VSRQFVRKFTPEKREEFFATLAAGKSPTAASAAAGITRQYAYLLRREDPDFKALWDDAVEAGTDLMEDESHRRAVEGIMRPVFYQGDECGHVREFSDTLMIVNLKARRPDKYRERVSNEHTGKDGQPLLAIITRVRRAGDT
jgi:hypothetical protein